MRHISRWWIRRVCAGALLRSGDESIGHILVDHARSHLDAKRGAGAAKLSLDQALEGLAALDPQQGRIVGCDSLEACPSRRRPVISSNLQLLRFAELSDRQCGAGFSLRRRFSPPRGL